MSLYLDGKRIVIFGGTGFIGKNLINLLSKSSCTNKEGTSDDEDGHEGAECKVGLTTLGQKRKNVVASSVTNVLEDRQVAAKRRFVNFNGSE